MKTYTVLVTRDATESVLITVNARSLEGARDIALDVADAGSPEWELNDGGGYEPYLGSGLDDVTEVVA